MDDDFFIINKAPKALIVDEMKVTKKKKKRKKPKVIESPENDLMIHNSIENIIQKDQIKEIEIAPEIDDIMAKLQSVEQESKSSRERLKELQKKPSRETEIELTAVEEIDDDELERENIEKRLNSVGNVLKKSIGEIKHNSLPSSKIYVFKVVSDLPCSEGVETVVKIKGNKRFRKLLATVLQHLASTKYIEPQHRHHYNLDAVVLLWKSTIKIYDYMLPMSLPIPKTVEGDEAHFTVNLITKEAAHSLDMNKAELKKLEERFDQDTVLMADQTDSEDDEEIVPSRQTEENANTFMIVLKDREGQKIEIQVKPETKLSNVANYYIDKKGLARKKVKLIFDDEELPLNGTVGDTELENEFEVDVMVD